LTACLQTLKGVVFDVLFDEFLYVDHIVDKSTTFLRWFVPSLGAINVAVDQRILNTLFSFCLGQIKTLFEALKRSGGVALLWSKCRRIIPNFNYSWQVIRVKVNSKNLSSQKSTATKCRSKLQNSSLLCNRMQMKIRISGTSIATWYLRSLQTIVFLDNMKPSYFGCFVGRIQGTFWLKYATLESH